MSSSVPQSMSSNAALSPGRSVARCRSKTVKLCGSTSALVVVAALVVTGEVDGGREAQQLVI